MQWEWVKRNWTVGVDKKKGAPEGIRKWISNNICLFAFVLLIPAPPRQPNSMHISRSLYFFFAKLFLFFCHTYTYNDFVAVSVFWQPTKATSNWVLGGQGWWKCGEIDETTTCDGGFLLNGGMDTMEASPTASVGQLMATTTAHVWVWKPRLWRQPTDPLLVMVTLVLVRCRRPDEIPPAGNISQENSATHHSTRQTDSFFGMTEWRTEKKWNKPERAKIKPPISTG